MSKMEDKGKAGQPASAGGGSGKFVPEEKLSKRRQRELHRKRRGSWGSISPVTRRTPNPKAYRRKKNHQGDDETFQGGFFLKFFNHALIFAPLAEASGLSPMRVRTNRC